MNSSFAFCAAAGAVILAITISGCQKTDEPASRGRAPAAEAPTATGGVASAPASELSPAIFATGEATAISKEQSGEFF